MNVYAEVLSAINEIKRTGFTVDTVEPDFYLGGDLGVDSREMLEIWYELEQRLSVRIADSDKRDRYTLQDVVDVLSAQLNNRALVA
ncbi:MULTISPECIES: acyl carrier protein [Xanthomonas]|jgi:acyl carrier protein|uniref:acyl carrier protein n=1 Tax=Xanthomonas TaxID=338 RepID=UPI0015CBD19D|nr:MULTISPECIES: acyl carrier protein [Xanthomonas]NYF19086.1 acyl carrier protein [Xanthomonas sp. JAI131]